MSAFDITISDGAYATDGGSICLEATEAAGRVLHIVLDWSISAQQAGSTCLTIDGIKLEPQSAEEAKWIESLRRAHITGGDGVAMLRDSILQRLHSPRHGRRDAPPLSPRPRAAAMKTKSNRVAGRIALPVPTT